MQEYKNQIVAKKDNEGNILADQPMKYDLYLSVDANAGNRYFFKFVDYNTSNTMLIDFNTTAVVKITDNIVFITTLNGYYELCPENVASINSIGVSDIPRIVGIFDSIFFQ